MKKLLKRWVDSFLKEDMFKQVRAVQHMAVLGFILFFVVLLYLWQLKINLTVPEDGKRKIIDQKNIFELLIEKR